MTQLRKLRDTGQQALEDFMALLDDDDLHRLNEAVQLNDTTPNWWFRDEITAELQRRKDR